MNEIIKNIKQRRSIRNFESRQLSEGEINAIIEAGIYAPSVHNSQGLAQDIGIPDGYEPFHGIALGYKKEDASIPNPKWNYDVVNYIR